MSSIFKICEISVCTNLTLYTILILRSPHIVEYKKEIQQSIHAALPLMTPNGHEINCITCMCSSN